MLSSGKGLLRGIKLEPGTEAAGDTYRCQASGDLASLPTLESAIDCPAQQDPDQQVVPASDMNLASMYQRRSVIRDLWAANDAYTEACGTGQSVFEGAFVCLAPPHTQNGKPQMLQVLKSHGTCQDNIRELELHSRDNGTRRVRVDQLSDYPMTARKDLPDRRLGAELDELRWHLSSQDCCRPLTVGLVASVTQRMTQACLYTWSQVADKAAALDKMLSRPGPDVMNRVDRDFEPDLRSIAAHGTPHTHLATKAEGLQAAADSNKDGRPCSGGAFERLSPDDLKGLNPPLPSAEPLAEAVTVPQVDTSSTTQSPACQAIAPYDPATAAAAAIAPPWLAQQPTAEVQVVQAQAMQAQQQWDWNAWNQYQSANLQYSQWPGYNPYQPAYYGANAQAWQYHQGYGYAQPQAAAAASWQGWTNPAAQPTRPPMPPSVAHPSTAAAMTASLPAPDPQGLPKRRPPGTLRRGSCG
ncbi:hypothetical protein WJX73_008512 [Symbiochloris irregularis]|uniref:Uncharacterized protein n=1 Tax=Symbiochloris irregularis TaxID=706552 RepID=A0AAW1NQG2_9CHLO